ncbi:MULTISPECIES: hypothetical protein [Photorhabdus]|uniref:hypothetical protein n=1 Tax=Photorhabdus TaxID=29487 RepID=UPI0002E952C8|nr:hypothetical protein [Photorhabdus asymbiotica]
MLLLNSTNRPNSGVSSSIGVDDKEKERILNVIDKGYTSTHNNTDDEFIKDRLKVLLLLLWQNN